MVQDEPDATNVNEGTSTPLAALEAPSIDTPSWAVVVPTIDLAIVDPIATLRKYMLSLSTSRSKSRIASTLASTGSEANAMPFFEELKKNIENMAITS